MGMPIRRFPCDDGAPQPKRRRSSLVSAASPARSRQSPSPVADSDATDSVGDYMAMAMALRMDSPQTIANDDNDDNNNNNSESLLPSLMSSPARVPIPAPNSRRVLVLPRGRRAVLADAFATEMDAENDNANNNSAIDIINISDSDDVTTDTEILHRYQRRLRPRSRRRNNNNNLSRASRLPHDLARATPSHDADDDRMHILHGRQRSFSLSRANGLDLAAVRQVSVFYSGRISHRAPGSPSLKGSLHLCKTHPHQSNGNVSALSVVYADVEPVSVDIPNWWLIGTWPINDGNISAQTVFQLLMDVLHESGSIPSVIISDLLVCDELHTVPGVQQAISMLKRGGDDSSHGNNTHTRRGTPNAPAIRRVFQPSRLRQRYSSEALDSAAVLAQLNNPTLRPDSGGLLATIDRVGGGRTYIHRSQEAAGSYGIEGTFHHPVTGDMVSICVE